jgi:hypothetical protein
MLPMVQKAEISLEHIAKDKYREGPTLRLSIVSALPCSWRNALYPSLVLYS